MPNSVALTRLRQTRKAFGGIEHLCSLLCRVGSIAYLRVITLLTSTLILVQEQLPLIVVEENSVELEMVNVRDLLSAVELYRPQFQASHVVTFLSPVHG